MQVTRLHTVYQFRQSPWLTKNNIYNAHQRTKAKIMFERLL